MSPDPKQESEVTERDLESEITEPVPELFNLRQEGIAVELSGKMIILADLQATDYSLLRVIAGGTPSSPQRHQTAAMHELINMVINRSKLSPLDLDILRARPLTTLFRVGGAIEQRLAELINP